MQGLKEIKRVHTKASDIVIEKGMVRGTHSEYIIDRHHKLKQEMRNRQKSDMLNFSEMSQGFKVFPGNANEKGEQKWKR